MHRRRLAAAAALATLATLAACGGGSGDDHTGVDIVIKYQEGLDVNALEFSGWFQGTPAFDGDERPDPDDGRLPAPGGENLIVLLNPRLAGETIFLRVDGVDLTGSLVGSTGAAFDVVEGKIPVVELTLGDPRDCGDGLVHPTAEQCDDGDQFPEDGCTGECVQEENWECDGEPSVCRTCGNGLCEPGEDLCTCDTDCDAAFPDDGLCCPGGGETRCTSEDCVIAGEDECNDEECCGGEIDTCGTSGDCRDCGNGTCEQEKGEDFCSCPDDCDLDDPAVENNATCCSEAGEGAGEADCCEIGVVDGECCFGESAATNAEDCCGQGFCGDGGCCAGEEACDDCCDDTCKDEVCCGDETSQNCAQDCCPECDSLGGPDSCFGCCASLCQANQGCQLACPGFGCSCIFECEQDSSCDVDCAQGNCDVTCAPGATCDVMCSGGIIVGGDGGPPPPMDSGFAPVGPGGNCVCRGAGCNVTCGAAAAASCGGDVFACGPCPPI